ncbi:MAG: GAF domain-containing protein [Gemmatimonadales bacterium]
MTTSAPATLPAEVLAAIAQATAELAPPERVYDTLRVQTERLLETDAFYLALWDEIRGLIHFVAHHDAGQRVPPSETPLGEGPTSWVIRNRRSYRYQGGDDTLQVTARAFGTGHLSGSALHVPLLVGDRLVGVISAQAYREGAYTADSQRLLEALAAHAAIALEVGRIARSTRDLENEARRRLDQLDALGQVAHLLASVDDAQRTMEATAREGVKVFGASRGGVLLIAPNGGSVECPVSINLSRRYLDAVAERFYQIPSTPGIMAGEPFFFEDRPTAPDSPVAAEAHAEGFRTLAVLPLVYSGETIGLLAFMHDAPHVWSAAERRVAATFADQAALAIGKSRLLDRVTQAKAEWQAVFDATPSGLAVLDQDGHIQRANRWIADLAGVEPAALPGLELKAVTGEWPSGAADPLVRARAAGTPLTTLVPGHRGRLLVLTAAPQKDGRIVVAIDDVTEVVRTEARYRALFRAAPVAIVSLDRDGRFQSVNDAAAALFGPDLSPRRLADAVVPAERDQVVASLGASFRGERRDFIFHVAQADGTVREAQCVAVPVEERGGVATVLVLARDVTDEVLLRERVGQSEKMAALGLLVSGVAHEINNPLAGIAALSQALLADGSGDDGTDRVLQSIRGEAERAGRIVKDLLAFSRPRPLDRRPVDLNAVVGTAMSTPGIGSDRWDLTLAPDLPHASGDAEQLVQVILNLMSNAEHAMEGHGAGRGTIRTWSDGAIVGCEILDSGPGIPPDAVSRVFEPFFTTKSAGQGTGLGLSISHGIIRAHGGEIRAQNRPDGGARFWFELPRGDAAASR